MAAVSVARRTKAEARRRSRSRAKSEFMVFISSYSSAAMGWCAWTAPNISIASGSGRGLNRDAHWMFEPAQSLSTLPIPVAGEHLQGLKPAHLSRAFWPG